MVIIDVYGCLLMFIYLFNGNLFRFAMEHGWIHLAHGYTDDEATDGEFLGPGKQRVVIPGPLNLKPWPLK